MTKMFENDKAGQNKANEHGKLVKDWRLDLGLNRPEMVAEMARHGVDMTTDYLAKIESGTNALSAASLVKREAMRHVLRKSIEEWTAATGLYTRVQEAPPDAIPAPTSSRPYIPEFADMPITPASRAQGELLQEARERAKINPLQAEAISGVHSAIIRALEHGHDITEKLSIGDARMLHMAFGLSKAAFSQIMDLQVITLSGLSKPLQAVAKALLESEE